MADYRQFMIANAVSSRTEDYYKLTDPSQKHFLSDPFGLGFEKEYSAVKEGNIEEIESIDYKMLDFGGTLHFYGDTANECYRLYNEFIQYVKLKPLRFICQTPNSTNNKYCDCVLVTVDKKEMDPKTQALPVDITFHRTSPWTTDEIIINNRNEIVGEGKFYDLTRDYYYAGNQLNNIEINNDGTDAIGFRFDIDGYVEAPRFSLIQNGVTYGHIALTGDYSKVTIISEENFESIYLELNGVEIPNPFNDQDFDTVTGNDYFTFIKIKPGSSIGNFSCDNIDTFDGNVRIIYKNSYSTVI